MVVCQCFLPGTGVFAIKFAVHQVSLYMKIICELYILYSSFFPLYVRYGK